MSELEIAALIQLEELREQRDRAILCCRISVANHLDERIKKLESELASLLKRGSKR